MSIDTQSSLRQELKAWEQAFLLQHGRKPSRTDIKNDQGIAEKYKRFNRARNSQTSQLTPEKPQAKLESTKRVLTDVSINAAACTPSKTRTPRKQYESHLMPTPLNIKFALGPTPQKDGHVLGLFDDLLTSGSPEEVTFAVLNNPGKDIELEAFEGKHSRTPQSSSKRFYLDAFAGTPLKRKRSVDDVGTPGSIRRTFATPAFLRRETSMPDLNAASTAGQRPKRGLVRSLSTIIANLRKHEEEKMDEEWDIMREMEQESADEHAHNTQTRTRVEPVAGIGDMPLGPDQAPEELRGDDTSGIPGKVWKKRGLKRQTKKVNMKPVLHAPKKAAEVQDDADKENEDVGIVKKAARKVNEAAHMNFRRLKIKNKNSKASGRGRFGRR